MKILSERKFEARKRVKMNESAILSERFFEPLGEKKKISNTLIKEDYSILEREKIRACYRRK